MTEQHLHLREALQALKENFVHLGLDERIAARPAKLVGARLDRRKALAAGGVETHPVVGRDVRLHQVGKPSRLQRAQRLVVNADGAWVVDDLLEFLDHQHVDPGQSQRVGNRQADGASADDDHVVRVG